MSWPVDPQLVALDLVDEADAAAVERLLAEDPTFAAAVEESRRLVATLRTVPTEAWNLPEPPPFRAPEASPVAAPAQRPRRRRVALWLAPVGGAVAAGIAAIVLWPGGEEPATTRLDLSALNATPGSVSLTVEPSTARLVAAGLPTTDATHHYEAWVGDATGKMVSMGTFRVDDHGDATVAMPVTVDLARFTDVDISLEADDGNPGHSAVSVFHAKLKGA